MKHLRPYVSKRKDLNKVIAVIYLYCLPLRMIAPFRGLMSVFHGMSTYLDFIIGSVGLIIVLASNKFRLPTLERRTWESLRILIISTFILQVSSIIMAIYIEWRYGSYANESAFSGILGMEIYYAQYVSVIIYNIYVSKLLSRDKMRKIVTIVGNFLLVLAYLQILSLTFGGKIKEVLMRLDIFDIFMPGKTMWKLSLTGKEGAAAGVIFSIIILPSILSHIITRYRLKDNIVKLILWVVPIVFMKSSTAYMLIIVEMFVFVLVLVKKSRLRRSIIIGIISVMVIVAVVISFIGVNEDIFYLIFKKVLDKSNGSTVTRIVPIIVGLNVFFRFPLLGCGNGLQGYFFLEYIPEWAKLVPGSEVQSTIKIAERTIVNGGTFWNGIISGHGVLGIVISIIMAYVLVKLAKENRGNDRFWFYFFVLGFAAVITNGMQGEFVGNYMVMFVLSIPFMLDYQYEQMEGEKFRQYYYKSE